MQDHRHKADAGCAGRLDAGFEGGNRNSEDAWAGFSDLWSHWAISGHGRAFTTDGYSPKTAKEKFDIVREGWGEQIKTDPRVRYTDMIACSQVDLREQISKIDKPTLILAGADDQVTTPADMEFVKGRIKGARLEVIADASHNLTTEKPQEVNAAIEKFLAELK